MKAGGGGGDMEDLERRRNTLSDDYTNSKKHPSPVSIYPLAAPVQK